MRSGANWIPAARRTRGRRCPEKDPGAIQSLGEAGRGVLEKRGAGSEDCDRERMERGDFLEEHDRARCDENDRRGRRFTTPAGQQRNRALMGRKRGVAVRALVQLRRDGETEREQESDEQTARDESAKTTNGF